MTIDSAISSLSYNDVTIGTNVSYYNVCDTISKIEDNYVTYDYLNQTLHLNDYDYKFNPDGTMTWFYKDKEENKEENMKKEFKIVNYRVHENVALIVTFEDSKGNKTDIKSVCNEADFFDLERGIEVCVFKYLCG